MNVDAEIFSKTLTNQIPGSYNEAATLWPVGISSRNVRLVYYLNSTLYNRLENKNHKIISTDMEKYFTKSNSLSWLKKKKKTASSQVEIERHFLKVIKGTCGKPTANLWMKSASWSEHSFFCILKENWFDL